MAHENISGAMIHSPELCALAKLSAEPLLILDREGAVRCLSAGARALVPDPDDVGVAADIVADEADLSALLNRASGSGDPVIGALTLKDGRRIKAFASVLSREPERLYGVRLQPPEEDRFRHLTDRIRNLDAEVARRRSIQAHLEDALTQRDLLYSELQHRVKNNLQLILALFAGARRDATSLEESAVLSALQTKLDAIAATQHLMYAAGDVEGVSGRRLAEIACRPYQPSAGDARSCIVVGDDSLIPNDKAYPLALILNELVTNAYKYGATESDSRVRVSLSRVGASHELVVEDDGPGFIPGPSRRAHTGLGLVRGLCRQIGGSLSLEQGASGRGARVVVRFGDDRHE